MTTYYIKCHSGYWAGLSHEEKKHLYTKDKKEAAKFFKEEDANAMECWYSENPLVYMNIEKPLEKFTVEKIYYNESNIV